MTDRTYPQAYLVAYADDVYEMAHGHKTHYRTTPYKMKKHFLDSRGLPFYRTILKGDVMEWSWSGVGGVSEWPCE